MTFLPGTSLTGDKTMCLSCRREIPSPCLPSPCFHCDSPVCPTAPCLTEHLCKLCYKQERMDLERAEARRKTSQQADKMLELFRWRFGEAEVGTPVLLAISGVDKVCCMFPNLLCCPGEVYQRVVQARLLNWEAGGFVQQKPVFT